jgi:hypothetical protein
VLLLLAIVIQVVVMVAIHGLATHTRVEVVVVLQDMAYQQEYMQTEMVALE